jgi:probable rRNA maturation factor
MIRVVVRSGLGRQVDAGFVKRTARAVLEKEALGVDASLSVVVTGDAEIQALNRQFRGIDAPTDVLAFGEGPTEHPFVTAPEEPRYLGDVIISLASAQEQAAQQGHSTQAELRLLIVHGILHLLGYDHGSPEEKARMWGTQDAILGTLEGKHDE